MPHKTTQTRHQKVIISPLGLIALLCIDHHYGLRYRCKIEWIKEGNKSACIVTMDASSSTTKMPEELFFSDNNSEDLTGHTTVPSNCGIQYAKLLKIPIALSILHHWLPKGQDESSSSLDPRIGHFRGRIWSRLSLLTWYFTVFYVAATSQRGWIRVKVSFFHEPSSCSR